MVCLIPGGLFNDVAFSTSAYLFSRLNYRNYQRAMSCQNKALKDLAKAKEQWYENEIARKDRIQQLRMKLNDPNHDIEKTNQALDLLKRIRSIEYNGMQFPREPQLNDFFQPARKK